MLLQAFSRRHNLNILYNWTSQRAARSYNKHYNLIFAYVFRFPRRLFSWDFFYFKPRSKDCFFPAFRTNVPMMQAVPYSETSTKSYYTAHKSKIRSQFEYFQQPFRTIVEFRLYTKRSTEKMSDKMARGKYLELTGRQWRKNGEKSTVGNFIICEPTFHHTTDPSIDEGWDGHGM